MSIVYRLQVAGLSGEILGYAYTYNLTSNTSSTRREQT